MGGREYGTGGSESGYGYAGGSGRNGTSRRGSVASSYAGRYANMDEAESSGSDDEGGAGRRSSHYGGSGRRTGTSSRRGSMSAADIVAMTDELADTGLRHSTSRSSMRSNRY